MTEKNFNTPIITGLSDVQLELEDGLAGPNDQVFCVFKVDNGAVLSKKSQKMGGASTEISTTLSVRHIVHLSVNDQKYLKNGSTRYSFSKVNPDNGVVETMYEGTLNVQLVTESEPETVSYPVNMAKVVGAVSGYVTDVIVEDGGLRIYDSTTGKYNLVKPVYHTIIGEFVEDQTHPGDVVINELANNSELSAVLERTFTGMYVIHLLDKNSDIVTHDYQIFGNVIRYNTVNAPDLQAIEIISDGETILATVAGESNDEPMVGSVMEFKLIRRSN